MPSKLSNLVAKVSKVDIISFLLNSFFIHILYSFYPAETSRRTAPGGSVNRPLRSKDRPFARAALETPRRRLGGGVSGSQPKGWAQPRSALPPFAGSPSGPEHTRPGHSSMRTLRSFFAGIESPITQTAIGEPSRCITVNLIPPGQKRRLVFFGIVLNTSVCCNCHYL